VGLALALGVAMYVTKVPVPFVDKVPHRTAEQDAAEAERNKHWDPNGALGSKNPVRPEPAAVASAPSRGVVETPVVTAPAPASGASVAGARTIPPPPRSTRDPAAILSGAAVPSPAPAASTRAGPESLIYFVQTGAFTRSEEADQQRAKLAMEGFAAKVTEREQAGRVLYRVRLGPFDKREEADSILERVRSVAPPATIVRVEKTAT